MPTRRAGQGHSPISAQHADPETRFESAEGVATLVDFMPVHQSGSSVVRLIIGEFGRIAMKTDW
jgi:hypothetical protein